MLARQVSKLCKVKLNETFRDINDQLNDLDWTLFTGTVKVLIMLYNRNIYSLFGRKFCAAFLDLNRINRIPGITMTWMTGMMVAVAAFHSWSSLTVWSASVLCFLWDEAITLNFHRNFSERATVSSSCVLCASLILPQKQRFRIYLV